MNLVELLERRKSYKQSKNYKIMYDNEELSFILDCIIVLNKKDSIIKICKDYKIGRKQLRKLLLEYKNYSPENKQNSLNVKKDLFANIETEEDAYWLGFLYADGYISNKGKLELSLKSTDYLHLLKFAKYCEFDESKVVLKQSVGKYFRCRISFALKEYKNNLFSKGMIPNKSLVLTYPKFLNIDLHRHFIRGYFDGDGCIFVAKKGKTPNRSSNVLGTEEFLKSLNTYSLLPIKNIRKTNNIFTLSFHCRESDKFLNFIYNNSTVYLDRKFKTFKTKIAPIIRNYNKESLELLETP